MLTLLTYNVLNRDAHYIEELLGCGVALCNQSIGGRVEIHRWMLKKDEQEV